MNWINVDNELPNEGWYVLGYNPNFAMVESSYVIVKRELCSRRGVVNVRWIDEYSVEHDIHHWMPLPQPPKSCS